MTSSLTLKLIEEKLKNLDFIDNFLGIRPTERDFKRLEKFKKTIRLKLQFPKISYREIERRINIDSKVVSNWINLKETPFIVRMLEVYLELGDPKPNWKWVTLNVGFGQTLDGPWIQVPTSIHDFDDIKKVIEQLSPLPNSIERVRNFFNVNDEKRLKLEIFAYLLGFVVGDFGKKKNYKKKRISSRNLSLKLTKKVPSNLYLGEFVKECVRALGFRMKRYKDQRDKATKAKRFYWESQYSIFFQWVFQVCLGLKESETTTNNPARMNWIFNTPKFFKKRFIQGISDSDGSVNFQSQCCYIYTYPNTDFLKELLSTLGIKARVNNSVYGKFLSILPQEAIKLPIFFPNKKISYRYSDLKSLNRARRIRPGGRVPKRIRKLIKKYYSKGKSKAKIMKDLVYKHRLVLSYSTLSRHC